MHTLIYIYIYTHTSYTHIYMKKSEISENIVAQSYPTLCDPMD